MRRPTEWSAAESSTVSTSVQTYNDRIVARGDTNEKKTGKIPRLAPTLLRGKNSGPQGGETQMLSTMQDSYPLTVRALFEHGERVCADSEVVSFDGVNTRRLRFDQVAQRARRLAAALVRLGVGPGERVGTF